MSEERDRQLCAWRVERADGTLLGEGAFFERDYAAAQTRAKAEATPYAERGAKLVLDFGRMPIRFLTF